MSKRSSPSPMVSEARARAWLKWLATRMKRESQTVFLIEGLQPGWLATRSQRVLCHAIFALSFGLFVGLILQHSWVMGDRLAPGPDAFQNTVTDGGPDEAAPWRPRWVWWLGASAWIFAVAGLNALRFNRSKPLANDWRGRLLRTLGRLSVLFGVWVGVWVVIRAIAEGVGPTYGFGLDFPILAGALAAPVYAAFVRPDGGVRTVEALSWRWRTAWAGLLVGLVAGLFVWLILWAVRSTNGQPFAEIARNLRLYPPLAGAGGFLLGGLSIRVVRDKTAPNEGIRLSLRNACWAGAGCGIVLGLVALPVLYFTLENAAFGELAFGAISFGVISMLVAFLWFGGMDVLTHAILRLVLWGTGQMPLRLARFLDYAAEELQLLQKVGGGYMFIHRHLLEHFAESA